MKLINWKKIKGIDYELTVSTRTLFSEKTKVYRGSCTVWRDKETGKRQGIFTESALCDLWKQIEWGDFPELEKK